METMYRDAMPDPSPERVGWQQDYPDWAAHEPALDAARAANAPGTLAPDQIDRLTIRVAYALEALGRSLFKAPQGRVQIEAWEARVFERFLTRHQASDEAQAQLDRALCILRRGLDLGVKLIGDPTCCDDRDESPRFRALTRLARDPDAYSAPLAMPPLTAPAVPPPSVTLSTPPGMRWSHKVAIFLTVCLFVAAWMLIAMVRAKQAP